MRWRWTSSSTKPTTPACSASWRRRPIRSNGIVERVELAALLAGPYDANDAIATVQAGAGGTESMDWTDMLLRMYLRWAEREGFGVEVDEVHYGDEAGIKSATFTVHVARTRTGCCPRSAASTGWSGSARSTGRSDGTRRSRPST